MQEVHILFKINNTLLIKLFLEPNPQPEDETVKNYYKELFCRMFPNSDDYIEFLEIQNIDRQYELAERIVHRLCYHANFPPSYYALLDIVCVENYQEKGVYELDKYIPRDHFIHTVYLYLLGIYVFFYNSEFYTKIINSNRFERKSLFVGNVKHDCIKDFLSEWKYFSLFHDIGYSAEILGNKEKFPFRKKTLIELKNDSGKFKSSLEKNAILNQHAYFGAIEIISKLVFAKLVFSNYSEIISNKHRIYRNFKIKSLKLYCTKTYKSIDVKFDKIPANFLGGIQLEKIYSNHCLKKLLSIIDKNDIIIIGLDKMSGDVGFITYIEDNIRKFVYMKELQDNTEFNKLLKTPDLVIFDDYLPKTFEFIYLLKDKNYINNISNIVDINIFNAVYKQIEKKFENDFKGIADENHFLDFPYIIYHWIYNHTKRRIENTKLENFLINQEFDFDENFILKKINNTLNTHQLINELIFKSLLECDDNLFNACNELLFDKIKYEFKKPQSFDSPEKMVNAFCEKYLKTIRRISTSQKKRILFEDALNGMILKKFEDEITLLKLYSQIFIGLKSTLNKSDSWFSYNYISGKTEMAPFLDSSIKNKVLEMMSIADTETVEKEYILKHGNTIDHGIISAKYAASVFSCYRNALLKADQAEEKMLLSVLLDIPNGIDASRVRYIDNYDHVFKNVLFAVFVHNLYPSQFKEGSKGTEYKAKMSDPFTYLALLCDGLQQWNRPRSMRASLFDTTPLMDVSEEYNIDIKGSHIFLSDSNNYSNQWFEHNLSSFDTYMANIKAFLKYRLT